MERWVDIKSEKTEIYAGDVLEYCEGVFEEPRKPVARGKARRVKIGERAIVAQILGEDKSWVYLEVIGSRVTADKTGGRRVHALKKGQEIKRKRKTVLGKWAKPKRLLANEAARAKVAEDYRPMVIEDPAWKRITEPGY